MEEKALGRPKIMGDLEDLQKVSDGILEGSNTSLDTFKEVGIALGNDPNFSTNITKQITGCNTEIGKLKEDISNIDVSWDAITGKYRDARAEGNKPPSWYQGKGMVIELANFSDVLVGGTELCILTTYTAWHDVTGGVVQFAMNKNVMYMRSSVSASAWTVFTPQRDGGNANTVCGLASHQLGTLNTHGNSHGTSFPLIAQHNLAGDNRFKLFVQDNTVSTDYAYDAAKVQGHAPTSNWNKSGYIPIISENSPLEVGKWLDFHDTGSSTDFDGRIYIDTGALCFNSGSNQSYNMNISWEIQNLKQSVVNGKQLVVNALNDKYGYNTGLATTHTHQDYAWWIGQIPTKAKQLIVDTTIICGNPTETAKYLDVNLADLGYFSNSYYEILLTNRTNSSSSIVSIYKKAYSSSGSYVYHEKVANGATFIYPVSTTVAQILVSTTSASGHYEVKIYKCGGN